MWNCGNGTNTRSEMLALWSLLYYARTLDIDTIQIAGDSKVIVEWFKGTIHMESMILNYWMECIMQLKGQFLEINIQHVYRELNTDADHLSKKAILRPVGQFLVARGDGRDPSEFSIFGSY